MRAYSDLLGRRRYLFDRRIEAGSSALAFWFINRIDWLAGIARLRHITPDRRAAMLAAAVGNPLIGYVPGLIGIEALPVTPRAAYRVVPCGGSAKVFLTSAISASVSLRPVRLSNFAATAASSS
jgi:hypothetical protein